MLRNQMLPFGDWLPDQPDFGNAVQVVRNAIPQAKSYRSVRSLQIVSNALDSACLGSEWAKGADGTYYVFSGDAGKLYLLSGTTFSDVSKAGGYTSTGWEFVIWGNRVIASSIDEPMQYYDLGTSTLFADLPGSPPKAKHVAVVRDFIVTGNIDDGGTVYPYRLRWSGFNNSEQWGSSQAAQSDYQDLFGRGGAIKHITSGETALIFQEHSIRRMTYVGPPLIFRIDEIESDRGLYASNSVAQSGDTVYYYSHDGFFVKQGNNPSMPIGAEKVDRFFAGDLQGDSIDLVYGAIDRRNKMVCWTYPSKTTGVNRIIVYRWDIKKWGLFDIDAPLIVEASSPTYYLDDLDLILGADIDTYSINVDSDGYAGGVVSLFAFNSSNQLCTFSGDDETAIIETGEVDGRISVKSARPITDGTVSLSVGTRNTQSANYSYGAAQTENAKNEMNFRTSAKYHRFKATISGGFNHAQGIEVIYREEGRK
ncbi:MAG: hypothetical protein EP323_00425 [Gammaproteobacteria bacterium]|nr:MAG: hypothetical protein EP323_00425 [Gammaproteobacteria bacterium]